MAKNTENQLKNCTIYSVFIRNHSLEGSFIGVLKDLDRIKALGVDIVWLMPIHPIGQINRKGGLGCPYSIEDYRTVNPEYGTLEEFKELIDETHNRGMKLIIDVVYNHTSYCSALYNKHPEYFYKKADGAVGNKVEDWEDVIDLDYNNKDLWDYQIETLKYWASIGVDGFRCDVAPLIPVEFWLQAREEVAKIKDGMIWLAETIDQYFLEHLRENHIDVHSDSEMYQAFDICYDYDTYKIFIEYLKGERELSYLLELKRQQEYIYPQNYIKLRFIENHDNPRAAFNLREETDLKNWAAFMFFEKGTALVYAGQELKNEPLPSLFDKDLIDLTKKDEAFPYFLKKLIAIKKESIFANGYYEILKQKKSGVIEARYTYKEQILIGLFNVERKIGEYDLAIKDGLYKNWISDEHIEVIDGKIKLGMNPLVIEVR